MKRLSLTQFSTFVNICCKVTKNMGIMTIFANPIKKN